MEKVIVQKQGSHYLSGEKSYWIQSGSTTISLRNQLSTVWLILNDNFADGTDYFLIWDTERSGDRCQSVSVR
jgi:hypothetical protein